MSFGPYREPGPMPLQQDESSYEDFHFPFRYEDIQNVTVWRAISARRRYGHWEYLYEDYVLTTTIGKYIEIVTSRGAQRISLNRMGPFKEVYGMTPKKPMKGTISIAHERKIRKLEEFP